MISLLSYILFSYWQWHYGQQLKLLINAWVNFLVFGFNFFSIKELLKTFFAPFHRYYQPYGRRFQLGVWLEAAVSNFIFRTIGAIVRLFIIFSGLIFEVIVLILGLSFLFFWISLPLILIFLIIYGIALIF
jgi:hypothetical protein